jgi:hypothetical protein
LYLTRQLETFGVNNQYALKITSIYSKTHLKALDEQSDFSTFSSFPEISGQVEKGGLKEQYKANLKIK